MDIQWLRDNREQLLAEAAHLDDQPGHTWEIAKGDDKLIREKQEAARFKGALEDQITDWFGGISGSAYITGNDLQAACRMAGHGANVRPRKLMEKIGFRRGLVGSKRVHAWIKGGAAEAVKLTPTQAGPNMPVTFRESAAPSYQFDWNGFTVTATGPFTLEDVAMMTSWYPSFRLAAPAAPDRRQWQEIEHPALPAGWRLRQVLN